MTSPHCSPKLSSSVKVLREGLSILEREFVDFKEKTLTCLHNNSEKQHPAVSEPSSMVLQQKAEIHELYQAMKELEEDNQALRLALRRVMEDLSQHSTTQSNQLQTLQAEVRTLRQEFFFFIVYFYVKHRSCI